MVKVKHIIQFINSRLYTLKIITTRGVRLTTSQKIFVCKYAHNKRNMKIDKSSSIWEKIIDNFHS